MSRVGTTPISIPAGVTVTVEPVPEVAGAAGGQVVSVSGPGGELSQPLAAGIGARLLAGSYYGQTIQIWSALITASVLAGCLVGIVGLAETQVRRRMGAR